MVEVIVVVVIIIVVHVVQRWMMSAMIKERIYHVIYASIT